ncbi:MAG: OmpH family outer membrane protein [Parvibaculum sp.]|uniref:OmpH family outer membrane protein n=1 Tax=Parvibaculum sp. TaxID=2024848 RepID=UPI0025F07FC1|nr:OmpH family outer membrane protein [Parvibaculum sp.]MCE9651420.1 OmpH family outer membrane protein [Parvibaculum sp.]
MKFYSFVSRMLAGLAVASFVAGASVTAAQAAAPNAIIVIVNSEQLFAQSKVGQSVRTQIQALAKKLQAEGKTKEDALKAEAKKLGEQRALLSEADFGKKVQAFEQKQQDVQQSMQKKGQALQVASNKARGQIETAIRPIFADIMKAHGANILLDQSVVLAGGVDLDVTAEVLKALDAKITTVSVKPE